MGKMLSTTKYKKLVGDVRRIIEEGRARAVAAANQELVQTYWNVGKRICDEGLLEDDRYRQDILSDLSEELAIDLTTLKRCIYFFNTYKSATRSTFLNWSHYKTLIHLKDDEERRWYEDLAEEEKMNLRQLSNAIKGRKYEEYCESEGGEPKAKTLKRPTEATYVYKAAVENVIDGDTLLLRIDLGFQVLKEQRLRLAEIDCPAMDEEGGQEAYEFVKDQLSKIEFVMVKTNKIDIYGRYVGHIFYSFKETNKDKIFREGRYLNEELLGKGLAGKY